MIIKKRISLAILIMLVSVIGIFSLNLDKSSDTERNIKNEIEVFNNKVNCKVEKKKELEHKGAQKSESLGKFGKFIYKKYKNPRFGYRLEYPSFLTEEVNCENNSGVILFKEDQSVKLTTWGNNYLDKEPLKEAYEKDLMGIDKVTYKFLGKNYYFISWDSLDQVYYKCRIINNENEYGYILEGNKENREDLDPIATRIFKSIKIGNLKIQ